MYIYGIYLLDEVVLLDFLEVAVCAYSEFFDRSLVSYKDSVLMCLEPCDRTHMVHRTFYALAYSLGLLDSECKDEHFLCRKYSGDTYCDGLLWHLVEVIVKES